MQLAINNPNATATTTLRNSIIANNTPNKLKSVIVGGGAATFETLGFNLANDNGDGFLTQPTDKINAFAGLAPLASNGGSTPTHALLGNSAALDAGNNSGSGTLTDQRGAGFPRTVDLPIANATGSDGTDIGAFEAQTTPASPAFSINDVTQNEGNSGTTNFTFTVTLSAAIAQPVTVSYMTADDTATAPSDYAAIAQTTLTFAPGETSKQVTVAVVGDTVFEPTETFFVNLSGAVNATISDDQGKGTILNDDATQLQFSISNYTVGEAAGHATITVTRTGDTSQPAAVDYATSDLSGLTNCNVVTGNASQRCDYTAIGPSPLSFIAGQSTATFEIPIINDVYVEGPETLSITLSNPTGGILGSQVTSTLTITDNDNAPGAANPIGNASFFVRQHYLDFLNREPEAQGLQDWVNILQNCPAGDKRCDFIQVSSSFFRSREYFDRGYYIYRFYEVGLGRKPSYDEYQRDLRLVSGFLTNAELEQRKQQFAIDFSQRPEFRARYDQYDSQTRSQEYVDALAQTAGVTLGNRQTLAFNLVNSFMQRWDVLRAIVEGPEVSQKFFNKAFVVVGYFAYLRRDPDAQYLVWIEKLNNPAAGQSFEDTYREMIRGFVESTEYRARFGP